MTEEEKSNSLKDERLVFDTSGKSSDQVAEAIMAWIEDLKKKKQEKDKENS
jgi:broad-specificity NMP kinase